MESSLMESKNESKGLTLWKISLYMTSRQQKEQDISKMWHNHVTHMTECTRQHTAGSIMLRASILSYPGSEHDLHQHRKVDLSLMVHWNLKKWSLSE